MRLSRGFYKSIYKKIKKVQNAEAKSNQKADARDLGTPNISSVDLRFLVLDLVKGLASAKQQRDAPNAGKSYKSVDDAGKQRGLSATDPRNDVKLKQSDAAPVESTNDGQNQRNAIQYHHDCLLCVLRNVCRDICTTLFCNSDCL